MLSNLNNFNLLAIKLHWEYQNSTRRAESPKLAAWQQEFLTLMNLISPTCNYVVGQTKLHLAGVEMAMGENYNEPIDSDMPQSPVWRKFLNSRPGFIREAINHHSVSLTKSSMLVSSSLHHRLMKHPGPSFRTLGEFGFEEIALDAVLNQHVNVILDLIAHVAQDANSGLPKEWRRASLNV
ncbi:hypothetical protein BKA82DRAFT_23239 [Pisolithus tinctorius]|uniref:Uncharacterized protein n=1 Tax=Pisolithus tinctorius Marx 270 TaxID=870435 RepID=A0A0C3P4K7_PISTI|nr:hypothetical protein BKA82DRAFT_23239 [Pisolithus tinctorius]KIO07985.1 hypothetical protein M404DRAFT_23239 [Pisolithus tinctorius Marx 270]